MDQRDLRHCLALAAAAAVAAAPLGARADEALPPDGPDDTAALEHPRVDEHVTIEQPARRSEGPSVHLDASAGVGFPRAFAIEALGTLGELVGIGAEYGFTPTFGIDGVETNLWSIAGDLRLRPFRSAFFIAALAGRQHVGASTTVTASGVGSASEQLALDSWFINPRVGFLWKTSFGLEFGFDAGVQIPIGTSVTSSLPLALYPAAQSRVDSVGGTVLPTVNLLRLGFAF
jgi:hypothetical protein